MTSDKVLQKGYVKTINAIWFVVIAFVLGFGGGVIYTVYQDGGEMGVSQAMPAMTQQQQQMLASLVEKVNANPKDVDALTSLGHLYYDTGQPEKAIAAYEKSLTLDAGRPDVWTDLGVMYRRSQKPEKAVEAFDRALALNSAHEIALFNKGVVLMHDLNNPDAALTAWGNLLRINPDARTPGGQKVNELVEELKKNNPS